MSPMEHQETPPMGEVTHKDHPLEMTRLEQGGQNRAA